MKLTKQMLHELIKEALSDDEDNKRPWYHGPFESDWDRRQKQKDCDDGDMEACDELEQSRSHWQKMLNRWVGDDSPTGPIPGTTRQTPEMPFQDVDMKRAVDAVNKPTKITVRKDGKRKKS